MVVWSQGIGILTALAVLPLLFGVIFGERPAPLIWGGVPLLLIVSLICKQSLVLEKGSRMAALGAGVMDMAANVFFLLSVRGGMLITASVIAALYPAPTVMLQRIVFGEKLGAARIAGLILALTGIALIGAG